MGAERRVKRAKTRERGPTLAPAEILLNYIPKLHVISNLMQEKECWDRRALEFPLNHTYMNYQLHNFLSLYVLYRGTFCQPYMKL